MINIQNLTKKYNDVTAVDDVSFNINQGEIVGLLGPNGAGKTTIMRVLTCFLLPTLGDINVFGCSVKHDSLNVRKKIGYLPENNPIYEDLGIIEYLEYVANLRKLPVVTKNDKIQHLINLCGLTSVVGKNISELSKGYKQRLGFAQALLSDPEILVLDEPTSGLDPNQAHEMRDLIKSLKKEKTIIISTHILPEVQSVADRVLIINKGKLIADDTTDNLKNLSQDKETVHVTLVANSSNKPQDLISSLQGVENVKQVSSKKDEVSFALNITSGMDVREKIFSLAKQENWILLEMYRKSVSLEDVFRKLTTENKKGE